MPRGVHINVHEGERVRAGEQLMDGPSNPHDILRVLPLLAYAPHASSAYFDCTDSPRSRRHHDGPAAPRHHPYGIQICSSDSHYAWSASASQNAGTGVTRSKTATQE